MNTGLQYGPPLDASTDRLRCILCGGDGERVSLKGMAARLCTHCSYLWLRDTVPTHYYTNDVVEFDTAKMARRMSNARDRVHLLTRYIPLHDLCDVGCGEGMVLQAVREAGFAGGYGIEPNTSAVQHGRREGLEIIQGFFDCIPSLFQRKPPKVVTLFHVLEHLDNPLASLELIATASKPGTFLAIEVPNLECYSAQRLGEHWELLYPEHLSVFSKRSLRLCVERAGFHLLAMGKRGFDVHHMGRGEITFRLGAAREMRKGEPPQPPNTSVTERQNPEARAGGLLQASLQSLLGRAIALMGRTDYLWLIAQKTNS